MVSSFIIPDEYNASVVEFFRKYSRKNALGCLDILSSVEDNYQQFAQDLLFFLRKGIYNREKFAQSKVMACGLRPSVDLLEVCLVSSDKLEVALLRCVAERCIDAPAEVEREFYKEKREVKEQELLARGAELVGTQAEVVVPLPSALNEFLTTRPLNVSVES